MKTRKRSAAVLSVVVVAAMPLAAQSHAGLVKSEPGRRAVLTSAPQQIRLCFNENVEPKFSSVALTGADGKPVELGVPEPAPQEAQCLVAKIVRAIAPGNYTVKYKVLSVDGHVVDYGFTFSVRTQ